jgi:hypothetical protein
MIGSNRLGVLAELLMDLKEEACRIGRFPENRCSVFWFDTRHQWRRKIGFKPFRCVGYNKIVRQINCLEFEILLTVEGEKAAREKLAQSKGEAKTK